MTMEKWLRVFGKLPLTAKDIARVVGILIWDRSIRLKHLADISSWISVLKTHARGIHTKADWIRRLDKSPWTLLELRAIATPLQENHWLKYTAPKIERTIFLASDATETAVGGVWLDSNGTVLDHFRKGNLPHSHIYVKEVLAIYMTVKWARSVMEYTGTVEFRIAVDNRAAGIAVMRCYSSNDDINQLLVRLWKFMDENNIILQVVDIHTDLNVADDPSRDMAINEERAQQTIQVLKGAPGRPDNLPKSGTKPSEYTKLLQEIEATQISNEAETLWDDIARIRRTTRFTEDDTVNEDAGIGKRPREDAFGFN